MTYSIMFIGVGGQGTILATKILCKGLMQKGYDIKMSEIHGASQRGGSVTTQLRFGEKVYSPLIGEGEADLIVAFEKAEARRALPFLKIGGKIIMDTKEIYPQAVSVGEATYPSNVPEVLQQVTGNVKVVEAAKIAEQLGNARSQNIVLLGALVAELGLKDIDWEELVKTSVPPATVELNLKGFRAGYNSVAE